MTRNFVFTKEKERKKEEEEEKHGEKLKLLESDV